MAGACSFRCKHCHQQFSEKAVYQESTVLLCPHCLKTFIPSFWFYLRKEWIEPLSVAIVLALFIKRIIFEIYVIPTSSMEPTLHGGGHYPEDGGDKVLVNKFIYHFTEPKNWDVIVFEPPHENHLFIKRLVGLPNQKVQIVNGDIYIDGKVNRKPPEVEKAMLYPVYDSRETVSHLSHFSDFEKEPWVIESGWRISENYFGIEKDSGSLKFNLPIDLRIESHKANKMQKESGLFEASNRNRQWNEHSETSYIPLKVGDIQYKAKMIVKNAEGSLIFKITENETISKVVLNLANKKGEMYLNNKLLGEVKFNYNLNEFFEFDFNTIDDKLAGQINGTFFSFVYVNENPETTTYKNGLEINAEKCSLELKDVIVSRDVYYLFTLPDSAYCPAGFGDKEKIDGSKSNSEFATYNCGPNDILCFGDNVLDSSDSRVWGFANKETIKGQAACVLMPIRIWPGKDLPPQIPFLTHRTRVFRVH